MKSKLRKQLRMNRRGLTPADHALRSALAASVVARMRAFKAGARVAIYLPFDRETNTRSLLLTARRRGVRLYVPVISSVRRRSMRFHPLTGKTRRGVFGISIPHQTILRDADVLSPRWFNIIVVPLVGVDESGRRLGMGGGFYDRAFTYRRHRLRWRGPQLVGLAFDCQRIESVHADPWDLRLDCLATESGLRRFQPMQP